MSLIKRTKFVTKVNKPYCKVCHDSGKSEAEYTSHFVKSEPGPKGVVVCPVLLGSMCNYCKQKGHTLKHCKELEKNKNQGKKVSYHYEKREKKEVKTNCYRNSSSNSSNVFQVLEEEVEVFVDKFPPLSLSQLNSSKHDTSSPNNLFAFSYASMAAKVPVVVKEEERKRVITSIFKDEKEIAKEKYLTNWLSRIDNSELEENEDYMNLGKKNVNFSKSWAEWSDSEDDGEMSVSELY